MSITETEAETPGPRRSIGSLFGKLGRFVVDVILPPTCLACRTPVGEGSGLCPQCWIGAGFIERPYCERLGTPFPSDYGGPLISPAALAEPPAYARARAVARYGDVVRDLTHMLKYGDRQARQVGGRMTSTKKRPSFTNKPPMERRGPGVSASVSITDICGDYALRS